MIATGLSLLWAAFVLAALLIAAASLVESIQLPWSELDTGDRFAVVVIICVALMVSVGFTLVVSAGIGYAWQNWP